VKISFPDRWNSLSKSSLYLKFNSACKLPGLATKPVAVIKPGKDGIKPQVELTC